MLFFRVQDGCQAVWAGLQEFKTFRVHPGDVAGFEEATEPVTLVMVPEHLEPEMRSLSLPAAQLLRLPKDLRFVGDDLKFNRSPRRKAS